MTNDKEKTTKGWRHWELPEYEADCSFRCDDQGTSHWKGKFRAKTFKRGDGGITCWLIFSAQCNVIVMLKGIVPYFIL